MTNAKQLQPFVKLEISSWQDAVGLAIELKKFFFRGQSEATLCPGLRLEKEPPSAGIIHNAQLLNRD